MNEKPPSERRDTQIGIAVRKKDKAFIVDTREMLQKEIGRELSMGEFLMVLCIRYRKGKLNIDVESDYRRFLSDMESMMGRLGGMLDEAKSSLDNPSVLDKEGDYDEREGE